MRVCGKVEIRRQCKLTKQFGLRVQASDRRTHLIIRKYVARAGNTLKLSGEQRRHVKQTFNPADARTRSPTHLLLVPCSELAAVNQCHVIWQ